MVELLKVGLILISPVLLFVGYALARILFSVAWYLVKKRSFDSLPRLGNKHFLELSGLGAANYYPNLAKDFIDHFPKGIPPLIYAGPGLNGNPVVLVHDMAALKSVSDDTVFPKLPLSYDLLGDLIGDGLVTSKGDFWHSQRNLINPWFHAHKLKQMHGTMVQNGDRLVARIKAEKGKPIEVAELMGEVTQTILIDTMFSGKLDAAWMHEAWAEVNLAMTGFFVGGFLLGPTVNRLKIFPWTRKAFAARDAIKAKIQVLIDEARKTGGDEDGNFIEYLVANGSTDHVIFEESLTMLFAGHDTTKNTLSWLFYFLGQNPALFQRLQQEVDTELKGAPPTVDDYNKLRTCRYAFLETLRMRPPAASLERIVGQDIDLAGFQIPKGTTLMYYLYGPLMDPKYWKDPLVFNPDRFADDALYTSHFTPFSMGARNCIGQKFAMQEAVILGAQLLQNFDLHYCNEYEVNAVFEGTMVPKGLHCKFIERKK